MLKLIRFIINSFLAFQSTFLFGGNESGYADKILIYTTKAGVQIFIRKGKKPQSPYDFKVSFMETGKRERTPTHVHLIVEMYVKQASNYVLTLRLRDHVLNMFSHIKPISQLPPELQFFKSEHVNDFAELDKVGEFTVEFLLVVTELIMIQEKTNYPRGSLTQKLYADFGVKDRFSVISSSVFRG